jgi:RimJ/RimL family protein N-acetyltransferase
MEKMPFQPDRAAAQARTAPAADMRRHAAVAEASSVTRSDWRQGLPLLASGRVTLRELRREDAATLFSMLSTEEVARFISPPPATVEGFERFIDWANQERECGNYACFGVVPEGMSSPVGLFQLRSLEFGFGLAEWGFALGSAFWGSETFTQSANLVLEFAFETIGVHRLEARASVANGRGNGALRKIGAVQEGVLRRSFLRNGEYHDQLLWSILVEDWQSRREQQPRRIH